MALQKDLTVMAPGLTIQVFKHTHTIITRGTLFHSLISLKEVEERSSRVWLSVKTIAALNRSERKKVN